MARTVDPVRHRARRLQIIDAAITCISRHGVDGATTAEICRTAGIGSGTLFHYFPTKESILVAVLEEDTSELVELFHEQQAVDGWAGVLTVVDRSARDAADPRTAGFVVAFLAHGAGPELAEALAANDSAMRRGLRGLLGRAQQEGTVRADLPPERLASWVALLLDGFVGRVVTDPGFDVAGETAMLREVVERVLRPG